MIHNRDVTIFGHVVDGSWKVERRDLPVAAMLDPAAWPPFALAAGTLGFLAADEGMHMVHVRSVDSKGRPTLEPVLTALPAATPAPAPRRAAA